MDPSSWVKRIHALRALGSLVVSTGSGIAPYTDYPQLLPFLLKALLVCPSLPSSGFSHLSAPRGCQCPGPGGRG